MLKICSLCNQKKDEDLFYKRKRKGNNGTVYEYRESRCKSCVEQAKYIRRKANPESYAKMLERGRKKAKKAYTLKPHLSKERQKQFIKKHILEGTFKNKWIKSKYSITLTEYNKMRESQNYSCKICNTSEEFLGYLLHIDHCHTTGKIRGLLCVNCNTALGKIEKAGGPELFVKYLK